MKALEGAIFNEEMWGAYLWYKPLHKSIRESKHFIANPQFAEDHSLTEESGLIFTDANYTVHCGLSRCKATGI